MDNIGEGSKMVQASSHNISPGTVIYSITTIVNNECAYIYV